MDYNIKLEVLGLRNYIAAGEMILIKKKDTRQIACIKFLGEYLVFPTYLDTKSPQILNLVRTLEDLQDDIEGIEEVNRVVITQSIAREFKELLW